MVMPKEDIGQKTLRDAFRQSRMNKDGNEIKLSHEEAEKFQKAFGDEQFRKMFADYVSEISDPKHRAEQDEYIRQLEAQNEVPEGKNIIRPKPAFTIKFKMTKKSHTSSSKSKRDNPKRKQTTNNTTEKTHVKLFANVVYSDEIKKPDFKSKSQTNKEMKQSEKGKEWTVPYSIGPMRMEADKRNKNIPTFDCCFHPNALLLARKNNQFRDLIINTVREGITQIYRKQQSEVVAFDDKYHILKGVNYKNGNPPVMVVGTTELIDPRRETENVNKVQSNKKIQETDLNFGAGLKAGFLNGSNTKSSTKVNLMEKAARQRDQSVQDYHEQCRIEYITPNFTFLDQGKFDVADHTLDGTQCSSCRPSQLVCRISLPEISSVSQVELDVTENKITLKTTETAPKRYFLDTKLPYLIDPALGKAKFDISKKLLSVTLPLQKVMTSPVVNDRIFDVSWSGKSPEGDDLQFQDEEGEKTKVEEEISQTQTKLVAEKDIEISHSRWIDTTIHPGNISSNKATSIECDNSVAGDIHSKMETLRCDRVETYSVRDAQENQFQMAKESNDHIINLPSCNSLKSENSDEGVDDEEKTTSTSTKAGIAQQNGTRSKGKENSENNEKSNEQTNAQLCNMTKQEPYIRSYTFSQNDILFSID